MYSLADPKKQNRCSIKTVFFAQSRHNDPFFSENDRNSFKIQVLKLETNPDNRVTPTMLMLFCTKVYIF
jgi:hypothetical protein